MLRLKVKDTIHLHLSYWFQHGFRKFHSGETLKNLLEEFTFLEIDFFRKILVLALAGAQRGVNAVQRAVIQA